jgi:anti-sigma B factor antagonist
MMLGIYSDAHFAGGTMTVSERAAGSVTILDIAGNLTLGEGANHLRDKVRSLLQQGRKHILINLAGVAYMDSAGLGELVQTFATTSRQGGVLRLLNVTKRLQDLLVITRLVNVFECFDDEQSAVMSFGAAT